jgi:hypothetical protein
MGEMTVFLLVIDSESEVREWRRHFIYKSVPLLMHSVPYNFSFLFQMFLFFSLSKVDLESFQRYLLGYNKNFHTAASSEFCP